MNLFERIFRKNPPPPPPLQANRAELLSGGPAVFTPWSGNAYDNDIYRGAVDAIARNAAKLKGSHVVQHQDHTEPQSGCRINRILQIQPNPHMSAYDLLYKMITHYFLYNNSFAYLQKDERGELAGVFPLQGLHVDFLIDSTGTMYCKFLFQNGKEYTFPYQDVVHLRRNFNQNDLLGDPNTAIIPALELAHTQNEGIINGIKTGAQIRGILHYTQIMAPEKLKEEKDRFMSDYLSMANSGGVVATDQKTEYTPITTTPVTVDEKQQQAAKTKIYDYLGISETIVNSSYTEDQWAAFYESTIEPIALQLSLEFTRKIFSDREQAFGNSIIFESGRLQFSSNETKIDLIAQLMPYGLLTINQALEILNLPSVKGGDKRLQTLNVIDAASAKNYQLDRTLKQQTVK